MGAGPKERREALIAEASVWLAGLDSGSADRDAFEVWRGADPARAAAFAEVSATWGRLEALRGRVDAMAEPAPVAAVASAAAGPSRRRLLQAAGIAGVAVVGGGLFARRALARDRVETGVGERRSVVLGDSTRVELNTDTAVSWRVRPELCQVWLERGEAALSVASGGSRAVVLKANHTETRLWPGQFDARLRGGSLDLTILAGRAETRAQPAAPQPEAQKVEGPARVSITGAGAVTRGLSDVEVSATTSWRRGEIVFDGEPLSEVVEEYNRYLTRKLVIGDARISSLKLGGRFLTSNPDGFLTALNQAFGVRAADGGQGRLMLLAAK